jgi:hypothetical protein
MTSFEEVLILYSFHDDLIFTVWHDANNLATCSIDFQ